MDNPAFNLNSVLVIGQDFIQIFEKTPELGRPQHNHILTFDMAKEFSMIQRNVKGKQARKYFIEVEKKFKEQQPQALPQTFAEALKLAYEQQLQLEEQKPKVAYHDTVLNSDRLISATNIAKGLGISSAKMLNKQLQEMGIIYKQGKSWMPYKKYMFLIEECYADYRIDQYGQTLKWTEKGRAFIIDEFKKLESA